MLFRPHDGNGKNKTIAAIDLTQHNEFYNPSSDKLFYTNCANTKSYGCLTFPEGCAATSNCSLGATWIGMSATTYDLHLLGGSGEYVAIGFPQRAAMGPAPVLACDAKNSKPVVSDTNPIIMNSVFERIFPD